MAAGKGLTRAGLKADKTASQKVGHWAEWTAMCWVDSWEKLSAARWAGCLGHCWAGWKVGAKDAPTVGRWVGQ